MWHANPAQVKAIALAAGDDQFSLLIPHCFQFVDRVDDIQRIEAVEIGNVLQSEQYIWLSIHADGDFAQVFEISALLGKGCYW